MTTMSPCERWRSRTEPLELPVLPLILGLKDMTEDEPKESVATVGPRVSSPSSCHCKEDVSQRLWNQTEGMWERGKRKGEWEDEGCFTHVDLVIFKVPQGKELIEINKVEV